MTATTTPTRDQVADVLDTARAHIIRYGFCKKYLYDTRQVQAGRRIDQCAVDLVGALNVAVHGTPLALGRDPLVQAAEKALAARITAPSVTAWCDYRGHGKAEAISLLRDTADWLRRKGHA